METIKLLLEQSLALGASDLFVTAGKSPSFRINGVVTPLAEPVVIDESAVADFRRLVVGESNELAYAKRGTHDCSYELGASQRFRFNFFATLSGSAFVARPLRPASELTIEGLGLPESVRVLCQSSRGLILLAGATGSGKSTTLAAMVNQINQSSSKHILTLEDPIEFVHQDIMSLVSQREINRHAENFADGLRSALRENPDVIVVGELRDTETVQVAINAALTGHLVIATLHTANAIQSIERVITMFPEEQRGQVATNLALSLQGVFAQRLLPSSRGGGMVAAVEVLLTSSTVRKLIEDCNYEALEDLIKQRSVVGMQTFVREIFRLYKAGAVSLESARAAVDNIDEFELLLRGMESGADAFRYHYGAKGDSEDGEALDMTDLLELANKRRASDLVLTVGKPPVIKINGEWCGIDLPPLYDDDVRRLIFSVINQRQRLQLEENKELDFSLSVQLRGESDEAIACRMRVNLFYQRGSLGAAMRMVNTTIPTPKRLGIPPRMMELTEKKQGLIIVVGPTGSGKSTTLAALVNQINQSRAAHIITIEDPVEFIFDGELSIIEQREVYSDTHSFASALKYAMRQAPDIIMVGEMRDTATMAAALTAAETGHLVFATLHTNNAAQTIDRIIDSFPSEHQNQIRQQLAASLLAVLSQRLLPRLDGQGRIAAFELMIATPPICALIRDSKSHQIQSMIETSHKDGMMTLEYYLTALVERNLISADEVEKYATEAKRFG